MTSAATAPQCGLFGSFTLLLISMMLSVQASAFDSGGLSYTVIGGTTSVEVTGCDVDPCSSLEINIPEAVTDGTTYSVTTIRQNAFAFEGLTNVNIGNSVTAIGDFAFSNNALSRLTIPDSVTSIGAGVFQQNTLTTLNIGNSVVTIGQVAFATNKLNRVTIPKSVESIGNSAFAENTLTHAAFLGDYFGNGAFNLNMFQRNAPLTIITYAQDAAGWDNPPKTFTPAGAGSITATEATAAPVPVGPLWLLCVMAGLLSLVAIRKLRKA